MVVFDVDGAVVTIPSVVVLSIVVVRIVRGVVLLDIVSVGFMVEIVAVAVFVLVSVDVVGVDFGFGVRVVGAGVGSAPKIFFHSSKSNG